MLCTTDKRCLCYIMYLCTYVYILLYYIDTYEFHNCTKTNINLVISFVFDLSTNLFPMIIMYDMSKHVIALYSST